MPINFQTYRTIKRTLAQALHIRRASHQEQHLNTLALLICGSVAAQQVQFAQIADHAPIRGRKTESLIGRFRRWVKHEALTPESYWLPFAREVVAGLVQTELTILLDGTVAGRGCVVLMASLISHGHAIPLHWTVVKGKKGHLPEALHCALIRQLRDIIPTDAKVLLLGDGEFDGTLLQASITEAGWQYVCRTATTILILASNRVFTVGDLGVVPGEAVAIADVQMTASRYGPVTVIGVWDARYAEPLYLITSLADTDLAIERYRLRFRIECMFANHKSRGFHIHKSHLADPARLGRLLIATSLAYLWVHALALFAQEQDWVSQFHRSDRCDLSLFQIGMRTLRYAQREGKRVPVQFHLPAALCPVLTDANGFSAR
jgi:hypothetical protein